jgi:sec-independent protein translocase protein TatB
MFEVGFSELLLISVVALVVLGPERLPKLVGQVGRWVGKARSMARQFREQLESEVNLDDLAKSPSKSYSSPSYPPPGEAPPNEPAAADAQPVDQSQSDSLATAHLTPEEQHAIDTQHHDTPDYPYSAPGAAAHPESDVYGGSAAPEPERVSETPLHAAHDSHDAPPAAPAAPTPAAAEPDVATEPARLHDERV